MANWYVGQKIVCIEDGAFDPVDEGVVNTPDPIKGSVYTINGIDPDPFLAFRLEELPFNVLYEADCFRPVRTTDISIFTQMLKPVPETV